jgi:hypothetical protein
MQAKLFTISLLVYFLLNLQSVTGQVRIEGKVQDIQGQPIPFASVQVFESDTSAMISYALSDKTGSFTLKVPELPAYFFSVRHLSYDQWSGSLVNDGSPFVFTLEETTSQLESVTIQAPKAAMELKGDTVSYNLDLFINGREAKLKDLLAKLPGIEITPGGKILANGKLIKDLLVEGETVFGQNHKILLETLNAGMVDGVQLLNNYESNELLRGLEEKDGVAMNISIKEEFKGKISGDARADLATASRGGVGLNAYRFDLKSNLALVGDLNSLNRQILTRKDYTELQGQFVQNDFSTRKSDPNTRQDANSFYDENTRIRNREVGLMGVSYGSKLNKHVALNVFSLWSGQKSLQDQNIEREFLTIEDNPLINEQKSNETKNTLSQTFLALTYSRNKSQWKYDMMLDLGREARADSLFTVLTINDNQLIDQNRNTVLRGFSHQLGFTKRVNDYIFYSKVYHRSHSRDVHLNILSDTLLFGRHLRAVEQLSEKKSDDLGAYLTLRKYNKLSNMGLYGGFENQNHQLNLSNNLLERLLKVNYFDAFIGTSFTQLLGDFKFSSDLKLSVISAKKLENQSKKQIGFLPAFELAYNFSTLHTVSADFNRSVQYPELGQLVRGEVFSDYRNIMIGSDIMYNDLSFSNQLNLNHRFIDLYHGLTVVNFIMHTQRELVFATDNNFRGLYNEINNQVAANNTKSIIGNMTELRLSGVPLMIKSTNVFINSVSRSFTQGESNDMEVLSYDSRSEIRPRFSSAYPEIVFGVHINRTMAAFAATSQQNNFLRIEPYVEMNMGIKEKLDLSVHYGVQKFRSDRGGNTLNIVNFNLSHQLANSKWRFGIVGRDVLNLRNSELLEVSNSPIQMSRSIISRFPGYLGVNIEKGF